MCQDRQGKTFIIIILQVQIFCMQLAKKHLLRQINYIANQIIQTISKKQRKRKDEICVINSKAGKTSLFNATCERSQLKARSWFNLLYNVAIELKVLCECTDWSNVIHFFYDGQKEKWIILECTILKCNYCWELLPATCDTVMFVTNLY